MGQQEAVAGGLQNRKGVGRPKNSEKSVKMQLTMPRPLADKLEDLRGLTHHSSVPDLIRHAIVFYAAAIRQHESGSRVIFKDKDGRETEIPVTV